MKLYRFYLQPEAIIKEISTTYPLEKEIGYLVATKIYNFQHISGIVVV